VKTTDITNTRQNQNLEKQEERKTTKSECKLKKKSGERREGQIKKKGSFYNSVRMKQSTVTI